jgi:hypothetical protein
MMNQDEVQYNETIRRVLEMTREEFTRLSPEDQMDVINVRQQWGYAPYPM